MFDSTPSGTSFSFTFVLAICLDHKTFVPLTFTIFDDHLVRIEIKWLIVV